MSPLNQFRGVRRWAYIGTIYIAFILLLGLIEFGTRLALPHISSLDLFVVTPQQKEQLTDRRSQTIFEGDPLLLWRLRPNLDHVVWDFTVVSTNSHHLRSKHLIDKKKADTVRIVCLGDSVTFGYRVPTVWPDRPDEYHREWLPYPMLLENALRTENQSRNIEVISMAVPGYTSHQGLAWLRREIETLKPDLLTVSFGWNDVSLSNAPDRSTMNTSWYATATRHLVDSSQAFAHATRWLRSFRTQGDAAVKPAPRVSEDEYIQNMMAIVELAQKNNARLIMIAAPYRDLVTNPPEGERVVRYRNSLKSAAQTLQIPFMEIFELTESAYPANEGWFGELIHPNHMGHRLLTSELLKLIRGNNLLDGMVIPELTP